MVVGGREIRGEVSRDVMEGLGCAITDKDSCCAGLGTIVSIGKHCDPSTSSISMCTATVGFGFGSGYSSVYVWVCVCVGGG